MKMHHIGHGKPLLSRKAVQAVMGLWSRFGKTSTIPVSGRSMLPFIRPGDRLSVSHRIGRLHMGDVITFYDSGALVVHRIIQLKNQHDDILITTKGDNRKTYDDPVLFHNIVGRVVAVERNGVTLSLDHPAERIRGWRIAVKTIARDKFPAIARFKRRLLYKLIKNRPHGCLFSPSSHEPKYLK